MLVVVPMARLLIQLVPLHLLGVGVTLSRGEGAGGGLRESRHGVINGEAMLDPEAAAHVQDGDVVLIFVPPWLIARVGDVDGVERMWPLGAHLLKHIFDLIAKCAFLLGEEGDNWAACRAVVDGS